MRAAIEELDRDMYNGRLIETCPLGDRFINAKVAELVDALDLGSCGVTRESSSLSFRTMI